MTIQRTSHVPVSKLLLKGCIVLMIISFAVIGVGVHAESALQSDRVAALQNEMCLPGGISDSIDLSGVQTGSQYTVMIRNLSTRLTIGFSLTSGNATTEVQQLTPAKNATVSFTPQDTVITLNVDNTANTQQACLYAYIKEVAATDVPLDVPDERCVPANQSQGKYVSVIDVGMIYNITIENVSTENDLIVSAYGSGFIPTRLLSVKAEQKVVLPITTTRNGVIYVRINNLSNVTQSCAVVTLHLEGKAAVRATVTPRSTTMVVARCVAGSKDLLGISTGTAVSGTTYSIRVFNSSVQNTVSASLYMGTSTSDVYNVGPGKAAIINWRAPQNGILYLKIDNRGNRTQSCITARRLTSSTSNSNLSTPRPTATRRSLNTVTQCAPASQQKRLISMGSVVANKNISVAVTNLSTTNTISVTFTRGLATSQAFTIAPGKISIISLTSTSSGLLYMHIDNRKNRSTTCVLASMTQR